MSLSGFNFLIRVGVKKLPSSVNFFPASRTFSSPAAANYQNILLERKGEKQNIGIITFNRPKSLNALCDGLILELTDALANLDKDQSITAVIVTGGPKVFAAGADIKEMAPRSFSNNVKSGFLEGFDLSNICRKPIIAAVNGYALGGGCEVALMCDIIYAGENAKFAQPEITLGITPGAGGTQRIARSCGKSKAMEMCLTGDLITAQEAEKMGLVSKVVPDDQVLDAAIKVAQRISRHSPLIVQLCKESVNVAFETSLQEGLRFERKVFHAAFATEDQKEGMAAFVEKRKPSFKNN